MSAPPPDLDYLRGQIECFREILLGLANLMVSKEEFRDEALKRLEILRTAYLPQPVSESRLQAIEDCERWVTAMTGD